MTGMAQRMYTSLGPKVLHCTLEFTVELKHVISKENISFFLLMKQFKTQREMCINNLKKQKAGVLYLKESLTRPSQAVSM